MGVVAIFAHAYDITILKRAHSDNPRHMDVVEGRGLTQMPPISQVPAAIYGNAGEGIEARGGAEEGVIELWDKDAAWIGMETGEHRIEETSLRLGSTKTRPKQERQGKTWDRSRSHEVRIRQRRNCAWGA
jgi:hypothetical protein